MYFIQHCFICRPSDSTVSEDAGIEPRTVATSALAVRRFNQLARSHWLFLEQLPRCSGCESQGEKETNCSALQSLHWSNSPFKVSTEALRPSKSPLKHFALQSLHWSTSLSEVSTEAICPPKSLLKQLLSKVSTKANPYPKSPLKQFAIQSISNEALWIPKVSNEYKFSSKVTPKAITPPTDAYLGLRHCTGSHKRLLTIGEVWGKATFCNVHSIVQP
jgi:hypothetical protein